MRPWIRAALPISLTFLPFLTLSAACRAGRGGEGGLSAAELERAELALDHGLRPTRTDLGRNGGGYMDRVYTRALAALGVHPDDQTEEEALAAIRSTGIGERVAEALDGWARTCVSRGSDHYARANLRTALAIAADPDQVRRELRRSILEDDLTTIREVALGFVDRELPTATTMLLADTLDYTEETKRCIDVLAGLAERRPDDPRVQLRLGHYLSRGPGLRTAEALEHLKQAQALDPSSPVPLVELGYAHYRAKDYQAAAESCRRALELDPDFTWAHRLLSTSHKLMEEYGPSIASYREVVRTEPDDPRFLNALAWLLVTVPDASVHQPADAVRFAERAVELEPKESNYHNTLGISLYRVGEFSRCIEVLERSIELSISGGEPSDHLFLAMAWSRLEEDEIAAECYASGVDVAVNRGVRPTRMEAFKRFLAEAQEVLGIETEEGGG